MSSAPAQGTEPAATVPIGNSRRSLGRRIAFGLAIVAVVAASMTAGWLLQAPLHRADDSATIASAERVSETLDGDVHVGERSEINPAAESANLPSADTANATAHTVPNGANHRADVGVGPFAHYSDSTDSHANSGTTELHGRVNAGVPRVVEVAPTAEELARALEIGEQEFLRGEAAAALRQLDWVAWYQDRSRDDRFHIRCGICAEALGDFERALDEYGKAIATATDETVIVVCRLGQARVWRALGNSEMAIQLMASAFLTNGKADRAAVTRPFVAYLLAEALASNSTNLNDSRPIDEDGVLAPEWKFDLFERTLLSSLRRDTEGHAPIRSGVRVVSGNGAEIILQASVPRMSVRNLADALCRAGNRRATWTAAARQAVASRSSEICIDRCSLALCLDGLTAPLGVVWTDDGDQVRFDVKDSFDARDMLAYRRSVAGRALIHAAQEYPHYILASQARVTLGILAFQARKLDEAESHYKVALAADPRSVVSSNAWFNLGKLQLHRDQPEEALDAFWHVIDAWTTPESASVAYLFAGRLLLDAEQPRRAILPLTRAVQLATDSTVRSRSVLALAAAHLLYGNPQAANDVLMDFRSEIAGLSRQAAYLSALARYRFAEQPSRRIIEGEALLAAMESLRPEELFGRYGWYLRGQAYQELLLPELAIDVYRDGLDRFEHVPYRLPMLYGLATSLADSGNGQAAQQSLKELMQQSDTDWQRQAAFRLCRLQLDMDQPLDASRTARQLLGLSATTADKTRALQLLGTAYQRLGDHAAAALCFAGSTPGEKSADAGGH